MLSSSPMCRATDLSTSEVNWTRSGAECGVHSGELSQRIVLAVTVSTDSCSQQRIIPQHDAILAGGFLPRRCAVASRAAGPRVRGTLTRRQRSCAPCAHQGRSHQRPCRRHRDVHPRVAVLPDCPCAKKLGLAWSVATHTLLCRGPAHPQKAAAVGRFSLSHRKCRRGSCFASSRVGSALARRNKGPGSQHANRARTNACVKLILSEQTSHFKNYQVKRWQNSTISAKRRQISTIPYRFSV